MDTQTSVKHARTWRQACTMRKFLMTTDAETALASSSRTMTIRDKLSEWCHEQFQRFFGHDRMTGWCYHNELNKITTLARIGEEMDVGGPVEDQPQSVSKEDQPQPVPQSVSQPVPIVRVGGSSSSGTRAGSGSRANESSEDDDREVKRVTLAESRGQKRQGEDVEELVMKAEEQHLDADVEVPAHKSWRVEDSSCATDAADAAPEQMNSFVQSKTEVFEKIEESLRPLRMVENLNDDEILELCILSNELNACKTTPVLNPSKFASFGTRFGLREGFAVDLTTARANGTMWDLSLEDDNAELRRVQNREQPELLKGSPPSDDFSFSLSTFAEAREITKLRKERIWAQIRTCVQAYKLQMEMQKHFVHEHPTDSLSWKMPEVQSLVSDPRVYSIDGPMCRWSLRARGTKDKTEFMRKQTRWLTRSREIAEVLRGDCRWKSDGGVVHMTGKSETVSEYPASPVVAMLKSHQTSNDFRCCHQSWRNAFCRSSARWRWLSYRTWRKMEIRRHMHWSEVVEWRTERRNGVHEENGRWWERVLWQWLQTIQAEMGGQDERWEVSFEIVLSRNREGQRQRRTAWTRRRVFTHAAVGRVEDARIHNDDRTWCRKPCRRSVRDGNVGMCREHISAVKLTGGFTHFYVKVMSKVASWPDSAEACMERETQRQFGERHGQKCWNSVQWKSEWSALLSSVATMENWKVCVMVTISV